ncbi:hypothetical protein [Streptomyces gilvus]|uniref:hypothetical protein n=1 Tax=Streptomyces gilvus TaxID=2920937 RepID=UPI001F0DD53C|nr:hypothetical protein [Streptomyces sp. CME 23]MCH5677897.1 hypothetical protein [Streptomyces sp. CME 23]
MTEDELVEAIRNDVFHRDVPRPATREAVAETEAACGYPLPPLLVRLLTEVANGGFGPRGAAGSLRVVDSSDWSGDSEGCRAPLRVAGGALLDHLSGGGHMK